MSAPPPKVRCPHCPVGTAGSLRTFGAHGLKVHIGRVHKTCTNCPVSSSASPLLGVNVAQPDRPGSALSSLEKIATLRRGVRVLRHIPKGARNLAAGSLCEVINRCIETNETADWCVLLTFAYSALKAPDKNGVGNLTSKVKRNIETAVVGDGSSGAAHFGFPSVLRTIESKVFEGDLRGAVRLLMSDDVVAPPDSATLASLQSKHPSPSRPLVHPQPPDRSTPPCEIRVEDVVRALGTFHSGSSAGLDGIRPGHLKELTSVSAGDNGHKLLDCLTKLCNFLLSGLLNPEVCPYLYGASLCALSKKDGGLRPIAVGSTFRRLAAKLGCRAVREELAEYLCPHQLGFGTQLGCEAAIHATRTFATGPESAGNVIVKLDLKNAFNSVERDVLLGEIKEKVPSLYPFLFQVYESPSFLYYNNTRILSQVGAQQGDPLGPLAFSLAIHKAISELKAPLNIWYLDDGIIGGKPEVVEKDLRHLVPRLKELGLEVNTSKCEFFPCCPESRSSFPIFCSLLPGLRELSPETFSLLGSPVFPEGIPEAFELRKRSLLSAKDRLKNLSAHVALVLLRMCFAIPKMTYLLRTSPCWLYPGEIVSFDDALKNIMEDTLNARLDGDQWLQATLPIRHGGLGVRCVGDVGLSAFLASAHGVEDLVTDILSIDGDRVVIPYAADALSVWRSLNPDALTPTLLGSQRAWDEVGAKRIFSYLLDKAVGVDKARLRAVSQAESGAWLHALPSPHMGTFLDSDSLRVAVALRLGCDVCERHLCICGSTVESNGHHALSCCRCSGRFPRHHALNDTIRRALISANVPCVLEPPGLSRSDGKRPDGMTMVPWEKGRCLLWDATCVSTFAASHLGRTVREAGAAAESAAVRKRDKYAALETNYVFVPFAVETAGCWGSEAKHFVAEVGRRLRNKGCDPRSGSYLVQRLSIAIQRGNAASVMGTFAPGMARGGLFN